MKDPVVDTSVLIDMFDPECKRHEVAKRFGDLLIERDLKAIVPWTTMFEFNRAIMRIRKENPKHSLAMHFDESHMLPLERIPIDATFFERYFLPNLPYTKAADMLFVAIAVVDQRPLVSEDKKMIEAAQEAGADALTPQQFFDVAIGE